MLTDMRIERAKRRLKLYEIKKHGCEMLLECTLRSKYEFGNECADPDKYIEELDRLERKYEKPLAKLNKLQNKRTSKLERINKEVLA